MARVFQQIGPDRVQIREGGGGLAWFGLPFLAAGIFSCFAAAGVVPTSTNSMPVHSSWAAFPIGLLFTLVGGTLVFGRVWTTVDGTRRLMTKEWGLIRPMYAMPRALEGCIAVTIAFESGDSDSSDQFPILVRSSTGSDLRLCSFTQYATSRACGTAVARLLGVDLEDATTDHADRMPPSDAELALQQRKSSDQRRPEHAPPPAALRTDVTDDGASVRLVIPRRRLQPWIGVLMLLPALIPLVVVVPLGRFFRQTHTPDPLGWIFQGLLIVGFGILPVASAFRAWLGSRIGRTIVTVSPEAIVVQERGLWRTTPGRQVAASDIFAVDYSTRESMIAAARLATERRVANAGRSHAGPQPPGPGTERLIALVSRLTKGRGIIIKTRQGLTTFGEGLPDDEIRYLCDVIRRALVR